MIPCDPNHVELFSISGEQIIRLDHKGLIEVNININEEFSSQLEIERKLGLLEPF